MSFSGRVGSDEFHYGILPPRFFNEIVKRRPGVPEERRQGRGSDSRDERRAVPSAPLELRDNAADPWQAWREFCREQCRSRERVISRNRGRLGERDKTGNAPVNVLESELSQVEVKRVDAAGKSATVMITAALRLLA
jgi:hypothetical protein